MFKRGDVVKHRKWQSAAVVVEDVSTEERLVRILWLHGRNQRRSGDLFPVVDFFTVTDDPVLLFEASLALKDTARAINLYRALKEQADAAQTALDAVMKQSAAFNKWVTEGGDYPFKGEPPRLADQHFEEWFEAWKRDAYE